MQVDKLMFEEGSSDFYDPSFRNTLEAHLAHLRTSRDTFPVNVLQHSTVVYNQDLFGYLNEIKTPAHLHWLTMRLNNFFSPYDFNSDCTRLLIPSSKEVESLRQSWKTTSVITA